MPRTLISRRYGRPARASGACERAVPSLFNKNRLHVWLAAGAAAALLLLVSAGCGRGGEEANKGNGARTARAGQKGKQTGGQRRGPSQPPVPVAVEAVSKGDIASYYTATATLTAEKEAEILARATGVALALGCEEGDWVRSGQILLRVEDAEYRLRLAEAEARTSSLKDRHDRLKNMWEQQLVSAEEFQGVRNDLKAAEAAEGLARLNLSYTTVTAPFSGRVVSRRVDVGQNVTIGLPLFLVSDFDPLLAIVRVPSKEFKKLKPDQNVQIVLDSNKQRLDGRIKLVSPVIDPGSGTIKITVEIPEYPEGTRPGDFAEVSIVTERRTGVTLVPKIAVFTDRGDQVVYVAADSTAERRVVDTGFEDGERAQILSGVEQGEHVVVKGQRSLKHGSPIKILSDSPTQRPRTARTKQAGS